ncbi:MAG: Hsp20/alpha crystallin family protein [Gemmataceae bacterium]
MNDTNVLQRKAAARVRYTPRVDIQERADEMVIRLDVPGVKPDGVEVNFERGELTVRAARDIAPLGDRPLVEEFEGGEFYRAFLLSQDVAGDKIAAELRHGVLTVRLPRAEEAKPRKVAVKATV